MIKPDHYILTVSYKDFVNPFQEGEISIIHPKENIGLVISDILASQGATVNVTKITIDPGWEALNEKR